MKKLNLLLLVLILGITSCKKDNLILEENVNEIEVEGKILSKENLSSNIQNRSYSSSEVEDIFSERSFNELIAGTRTEISLEAKIANQILFEIEEEVPFIEDFLEDYGKPYWEYGYVNHNPETFNVAIPIIKDDEITSVFSFMQLDEETITFNFTSVEFNTSVRQSINSITQNYISHVLEELAIITGKKLVDEASLRTDCCDGGELVSVTRMGDTWVITPPGPGSLCFCDRGSEGGEFIAPSCCLNGGGEQLDGGAAEAGSDGQTSSIPGENWIVFHSYWLNLWNGINTPNTGIRPRENDNSTIVGTIIDTQNEQELITYLQQQFGWDANHPNILFLVTYPNIIHVILEYIGSTESVQAFIDFLNTHGNTLQLSTDELTQIINLQPQGRGIINLGILDNYLKSHNTDATSIFVLKEVLRLLQSNPDLTSAAPSILDSFYRGLTPEVKTWIEDTDDNFRRFLNLFLIDGPFEEAEERRSRATDVINLTAEHNLEFNSGAVIFLINNTIHKDHIQTFLDNHPNEIEAAREFITEHGNALGSDAEYAAFIESATGWSPIMWSIAKELIGDKVIDIVLRFIPGFGQSQNLKDAIKAISHGDPLEFIFESTQLVIGNTPLGQLLKGWEAVDEVRDLYKKTERIWDKIGSFTEEAIDQMWTIVKRYPKAFWTNSDLMSSIAKAIHRGIKSIDEVMASIPGFTQMSSQRMRHILHGDGVTTGGLHHASGLVNNPAVKVIDHLPATLTSKGVYKVKIKLPDGQEKWKDMFPDNKSEIGAAKSIQNVFNNPSTNVQDGASRIINGTDSAGIPIEIITDLNYNIITAYPKYL